MPTRVCVTRVWPDAKRPFRFTKGRFLAGLSLPDAPEFEQWQTQQREHFHPLAADALTMLTTYHEIRGELQQAITYAQQQLGLEPWREETHRQLMRLMLYNGQRSRAIAQFLSCVQVLDKELGVPPSDETVALFKLIETASTTPAHNLPTQITPFIGRQAEIAQITGWLAGENGRLITIVGPGGIGKTRLALSIAQKQLGRPVDEVIEADTYAFFTDGVIWVLCQRTLNAPHVFVRTHHRHLNASMIGSSSVDRGGIDCTSFPTLILFLHYWAPKSVSHQALPRKAV